MRHRSPTCNCRKSVVAQQTKSTAVILRVSFHARAASVISHSSVAKSGCITPACVTIATSSARLLLARVRQQRSTRLRKSRRTPPHQARAGAGNSQHPALRVRRVQPLNLLPGKGFPVTKVPISRHAGVLLATARRQLCSAIALRRDSARATDCCCAQPPRRGASHGGASDQASQCRARRLASLTGGSLMLHRNVPARSVCGMPQDNSDLASCCPHRAGVYRDLRKLIGSAEAVSRHTADATLIVPARLAGRSSSV